MIRARTYTCMKVGFKLFPKNLENSKEFRNKMRILFETKNFTLFSYGESFYELVPYINGILEENNMLCNKFSTKFMIQEWKSMLHRFQASNSDQTRPVRVWNHPKNQTCSIRRDPITSIFPIHNG